MRGIKGETWDFEGDLLTYHWALALAHHCGFRGQRLVTGVAVMTAESGRWTKAWHKNLDDDGVVTSIDRGLWQINSKFHPSIVWPDVYDPVANTTYAAKISNKGRYYKPWAAFTSGAYKQFMAASQAAYDLGTWERRLDNVLRRWPPSSP